MWKVFFIAVFAVSLWGCATKTMPDSLAVTVPMHRIFNANVLKEQPDTKTIIIQRDKALRGAGCQVLVYLDGECIANLFSGEKITMHVSPSPHIVGAQTVYPLIPTPICIADIKELPADLTRNDNLRFRVRYGKNYKLQLQPVTASVPLKFKAPGAVLSALTPATRK